MNSDPLRTILEQVAQGHLTPLQALQRCNPAAMLAVPGATIDLGRSVRCRFGEVIYGEGKDAPLIRRIATPLLETQAQVLITRCVPEVARELQSCAAHHRYVQRAKTLRLSNAVIDPPQNGPADPTLAGPVVVVTAGSTDEPVALEAAETLAWMGVAVDTIEDVGVAGPQRILHVVDRLRRARVCVVVAGMEGALPSVVAGHVDTPVIAVPTSVGYGAAFQGVTALLGMLSSCASNVAVVNIDAGFKGGYMAGMIASMVHKAPGSIPDSPSELPPEKGSTDGKISEVPPHAT